MCRRLDINLLILMQLFSLKVFSKIDATIIATITISIIVFFTHERKQKV